MPMALTQSARACSPSSLSGRSISSLSQSTGKKHAPPPMKSKCQNKTKQRCSTSNDIHGIDMEKCNKCSNSINEEDNDDNNDNNNDDDDNKNDNNITKFSKSGSKKKRCMANSGGDCLPVISDATPVLDDKDNPLLLEMIEKHHIVFMAHMYLHGTSVLQDGGDTQL
jgi:hypothetical protein